MTSKPEEKTFAIGHFAVRRSVGETLVREIVHQTNSTVQVKDPSGSVNVWRKLELMAVVPPELAKDIEQKLAGAQGEYRRRVRAAEVARQAAFKEIIKGYEAWLFA